MRFAPFDSPLILSLSKDEPLAQDRPPAVVCAHVARGNAAGPPPSTVKMPAAPAPTMTTVARLALAWPAGSYSYVVSGFSRP